MQNIQSKNDILFDFLDKFHILIDDLPISEERKDWMYDKCLKVVFHGLKSGKVHGNA